MVKREKVKEDTIVNIYYFIALLQILLVIFKPKTCKLAYKPHPNKAYIYVRGQRRVNAGVVV